jgi:glucose 1-dehydrogenase
MSARIVLITGVGGGVGRATAATFGSAGWRVVGVDVRSTAERVVDVDRFFEGDVSEAPIWQEISKWLEVDGDRLDALVNNAAIQLAKPLVETLPDEWDRVMASNVRATYFSVRHMHRLLCNSDAPAIVNVGSVHALATSRHMAAYAASKGALLALTRALAVELAPAGIRVNSVVPGAVDTPMLRAGLDRGHLEGTTVDERLDTLCARITAGRLGRPEEIASVILFLADSARSSYVTGEAVVADGGVLAKLSSE